MADAEVVDEFVAVVDVRLHSVGHGHTDDAVFAKSFGAKSCNNTAVLATRNADDCVAALAVHFKPIPNPLNHLVFYFLCIEFFHVNSILIVFRAKIVFSRHNRPFLEKRDGKPKKFL